MRATVVGPHPDRQTSRSTSQEGSWQDLTITRSLHEVADGGTDRASEACQGFWAGILRSGRALRNGGARRHRRLACAGRHVGGVENIRDNFDRINDRFDYSEPASMPDEAIAVAKRHGYWTSPSARSTQPVPTP